MKINVQLNLSEMFASDFMEIRGSGYDVELAQDNSFTEAIKFSIRQEVVSQVLAEWRKEIGDTFGKEVRKVVEDMQEGFLAATLHALVDEKNLPGNRYGMEGEKISIADVMRNRLAHFSVERNVDSILSKIAKDQADKSATELKARYDLLFASQLVTKMNANGMLREDVARLLLPPA